MIKNRLVAASLLLSCSLWVGTSAFAVEQPTSNQPVTDAEFQKRLHAIDSMVTQRLYEQSVPGYCLTIIKDGKPVFEKTYGFADLSTKTAVTSDTVFGLASLTKTFTAFALLSLVDKGMVGLDDEVGKYLKDLTPAYSKLTIRQLASMTGGVPSKLSREVDWKDQLDILDHTPLVSQPGSEFLYSNFSYRLLGDVIAKAAGRPYLRVVHQSVLDPNGMTSTGTTENFAASGRLAQGYADNQGHAKVHPIEYKSPAVSFAAGMLASTQSDMTKYVLALLARKGLSPASYQTMWYQRPPLTSGKPSSWAFGWHSSKKAQFGDRVVVSMNGGTPGVASTVMMLPDANCAVIALCNLRKPSVYKIGHSAFSIAFSRDGSDKSEQTSDEPREPGGAE